MALPCDYNYPLLWRPFLIVRVASTVHLQRVISEEYGHPHVVHPGLRVAGRFLHWAPSRLLRKRNLPQQITTPPRNPDRWCLERTIGVVGVSQEDEYCWGWPIFPLA